MTNREINEKYPFLKINDETLEDETWYYDVPDGWRIAFGDMMWDDIKAELEKYDYVDKWQIVQIKEKIAGLRIYDNGTPVGCKVWKIIENYSALSEHICIKCGKPDVGMTTGWIVPVCENCYTGNNPPKPERMPDKRYYSTYDSKTDKWIEHCVDLSKLAERIRKHWNDISKS